MARRRFIIQKRSLFQPARDPALARKINITSPTAFRRSITLLKKGRDGLLVKEKRALVLAQNRAKAQLLRPNLSIKERKQFLAISLIRLPPITRRPRRR